MCIKLGIATPGQWGRLAQHGKMAFRRLNTEHSGPAHEEDNVEDFEPPSPPPFNCGLFEVGSCSISRANPLTCSVSSVTSILRANELHLRLTPSITLPGRLLDVATMRNVWYPQVEETSMGMLCMAWPIHDQNNLHSSKARRWVVFIQLVKDSYCFALEFEKEKASDSGAGHLEEGSCREELGAELATMALVSTGYVAVSQWPYLCSRCTWLVGSRVWCWAPRCFSDGLDFDSTLISRPNHSLPRVLAAQQVLHHLGKGHLSTLNRIVPFKGADSALFVFRLSIYLRSAHEEVTLV